MDWSVWSQEAVALMGQRTRELFERHRIAPGSPYRYDLDAAHLVLGGTTFRLVTVGTISNDSFLWAWANTSLPARATAGIEEVRDVGRSHALALLTEPCLAGGLAQAKECLAIAGRVLDADGVWIEPNIVFALFEG